MLRRLFFLWACLVCTAVDGRAQQVKDSTILSTDIVGAQTLISGLVTDRQSGRALSHVTIMAEGGEPRTVSNDDGRFVLKTAGIPRFVTVSHIGYRTQQIPVEQGKATGLRIALTASAIALNEIIISADDPEAILRAAMSRIRKNYPAEPELVRCFYRETARRGSRFISVAEAVMEMYKTSYNNGPERDAVAILKGRRLMRMKAADTLGVKIQGGPVMPLMVDIAKNPDYLLNDENLRCCTLHMETPEKIDDRLHYVVSIQPLSYTEAPLLGGRLYIDQETLAFSRAELQLDMSNWRRAADYMLVSKPIGLHFRPKELGMTIAYHTDSLGVTRMSYVRNVMRFNCDWKRRLFASTFTTVSEMVVTDRKQHGRDIRRPRGRSSFGIRERFYDRVEYFEDPGFWADYNIIEPTESLENAIGRLKKRLK